MAVEVTLNTPLAEALSDVVQPKLSEIGWNTGGLDDSALGEYIILMLVNGKTQEQIAAELSNDLLNLEPDNSGAIDFSRWLFEQVDLLSTKLHGASTSPAPPAPGVHNLSSNPDAGRSPREGSKQTGSGGSQDAEMAEAMEIVQDGVIPTGPKSMRNGPRNGNKRLMGQLSKAMDRSSDAVLHRVRPQQGTERINMHNRQPPKGPRIDQARNQRIPPNGRPMGIANGARHPGVQSGLNMAMTPQQQMQVWAMYEEQARMMSQIFSPQQQQIYMPGPLPAITGGFLNEGSYATQQPGRSLFERIEKNPQLQNGAAVRNQQQNGATFQSTHQSDTPMVMDVQNTSTNGDVSSSMEVESSQNTASEPSPDTLCKFNLACTKKDCLFAHQSPAAPPGTTIDVSDHCPFGAACKNRKCVARHPSPSQKVTHQAEQDCKFFPNCTNPSCPFRHPTMPMCRNGADCTREGCKFTHVKIMCKFNPCLNPTCPYKHIEGQKRGVFDDKVWVAEGNQEKEHVSERKFVDDELVEEELIVPLETQLHGSQPSSAARFLMYKRMSSARGGHVSTLDRLLRLCYTRPACHKPSPRRHYSKHASTATIHHEATDVAVLGGGITGLASAYYLSKGLPNAKITLFEGGSRLGGWLRTETVDVGNGKVVFELGPRSLRPAVPNGLVTLDLVHQLGLQDRLLLIKKTSVGAQNRFIYYPDYLVQMPGSGQSSSEFVFNLFSEPVFKGLLYGLCTEFFKPSRDEKLFDESVGSFVSRRFGSSVADNLVSAILHGVYAGDINQLSIRSIAPHLWMMESDCQSVVNGAMKQKFGRSYPIWKENRDIVLEPPKVNVRDLSVFTFVGGVGELADAIAAELVKNPMVEIRRETKIRKIELNKEHLGTEIDLTFTDGGVRKMENFTHVISTISGVDLDKVANIPPLGLTPAVTVMVVNVFFSSKKLLPVHGFGYLIPRSVPYSQNPEFALGVVFDSDVVAGQDTTPGTKVTVMLGGHWWDGWSSYPDSAEGAAMARAVLKRHLGITEEPKAILATLQRDCIPQYTVGHDQRMWDASLMLERYEGRLRVAGSSYTGVGLNDCVRAAKDVVQGLLDGTGKNGLEKYVDGGPKWVWVPY